MINNFTFFSSIQANKGKNIPDEKGMYAWYLDFSKLSMITDKNDFVKKIKEIDELIIQDELQGSVKSKLKQYIVNVKQERIFLEKYYKKDKKGNISIEDKIKNLSLDQCKEFMTLLSKFSLLVNPLYVGIAQSLQTRWNQHRYKFDEVKKMQADGIDKEDIEEKGLKTFGGRLALRNFKWDYLVFAFVETPSANKKTIEDTEFLVNRLYSPIFGRR